MVVAWCLFWAAGIIAAHGSNCPVQLVSVSEQDDNFTLVEDGLDYLQRQPSPLYVVPVIGVYRGGKSFLLNRCIGLKAPYTGGFGVGHTQETHTRGIYVCAEFIEGFGTVVWMDTEGLFSHQHASGTYGTKMFSLAMLFSSVVMLNNVKVLNEQFFKSFGEQQQIARVLRQGLTSEGFPEATLLPKNLSIIWIVQQPVNGSAHAKLETQLQEFLDKTADPARAHVKNEFSHHLQVIPAATRDVRIWQQLDSTPDDELQPDFLKSTEELRELVLSLIKNVAPWQANGIPRLLRMYSELIQTERFSGKLARDAIEEGELSVHCDSFGREIANLAEALPKKGLPQAVASVRGNSESTAAQVATKLNFGEGWKMRLGLCFDSHAKDLLQRNEDLLVQLWQKHASNMAEEADCFFLDKLVALRDDMMKEYGCTLRDSSLSHSVSIATSLQRARLVECLKIKHLLMPTVPWLIWPLASLYIRTGVFSGLWTLGIHGVLAVGIYTFLRIFQQLPPYLDIDHGILQARPQCLDAALQVLPWMPWATLGSAIAWLGIAWSIFNVLRAVANRWRPAGDQIGGMVNLELKLNVLLRRSEVLMRQGLMNTLQETDVHVQRNDAASANSTLMKALSMLRGTSSEDAQFSTIADRSVSRRISMLIDSCPNLDDCKGICDAWKKHDIVGTAMQGEWTSAARMMVDVMEDSQAEIRRRRSARVGGS